ncbi:protein BEAN1 [Nerophis ophidion]|uniref:protein BEAN1 n=1 Tax=Nerophis ophidion TaxID=159077 RepID=UPI002AE01850|nr:protein BEAN1 [Nerophis ophidion]
MTAHPDLYTYAVACSAATCAGDQLQLASCLLTCAGRKGCEHEFMLMKLICSVSSNLSHGEYPDCRSERESGGEASLLVSPLVVAGIVIGLVLFLSCVTIIVGSLRKDSRLRNPHLPASYGPDAYSFGGSAGDLRSACYQDFSSGWNLDSLSLSQVNHLYPDSPPRYDECVGPDSTQIYIPTDDPPPYSLWDPCQGRLEGEETPNIPDCNPPPQGAESSAGAGSSLQHSAGLPGHPRIASISFPTEAAPPYEVVAASEQRQPLPLTPCDLYKHRSERDVGGRLPGIGQIS